MTKEPQFRPRAECAHAPHCTFYAMGSRKTKYGTANLCVQHLEAHDNARASRWCELNGLTTKEAQIEFIREQAKMLNRPKTVEQMRAWLSNPKSDIAQRYAEDFNAQRKIPVRQREPGDDDEPIGEMVA